MTKENFYDNIFYSLVIIIIIVIIIIVIVYYLYAARKYLNNDLLRGGNLSSDNSIVGTSDFKKTIITHNKIGERGDMGNQLFQLAMLYSTGKDNNIEVIISPKTQALPLNTLFALEKFRQEELTPTVEIYESANYQKLDIPFDGQIYNIHGYRQAYQYFDHHQKEICKLLQPREEILGKVRESLREKVGNRSYLAVHIRRGDYIKAMHKYRTFREFTRCSLIYYQQAIKNLRENPLFKESPILVCTDSPDYVKPFLEELDDNISLAPVIQGISPKFTDFCVLYLANGIVMSNSTYSWMAAYLGQDDYYNLSEPREVICPSPWWDKEGFIAQKLEINGNYLMYRKWIIMDAVSGQLLKHPSFPTTLPPGQGYEICQIVRGIAI